MLEQKFSLTGIFPYKDKIFILRGKMRALIQSGLTLFFLMIPFYPPKNIENLWFSDLFREIKMEY